MGNQSFRAASDSVVEKSGIRLGKLAVSGRYHHAPRKFQDDYELANKVLGTGMCGKVLLATNKQTGQKAAVKTLRIHGISEQSKQHLRNEVEVYLAMDHPQVTRLLDVYESEGALILVMECMEGGELFDRVVEKEVYSEDDAAETAKRMLLALNYLHSQGIVHRDVKLENFLYQKKDNDVLKLADFGFSKVWEPNVKMRVSCGTLAYVAPEVLAKSYDSQCDMWSLGVCVFILLAGYMPFDGSDCHQMVMIRSGTYSMDDEKWDNVSEQGKDFVKKLLVVNPKKRLTAAQALEHPWVVSHTAKQADGLKNGTTTAVDQAVVASLRSFAKASKFKRVCLSMCAWSLSFEERTSVRAAFEELDRSHKGTVKLSDLKEVLESRYQLNDEDVQRVFDSLDVSHDHKIHYSEFLAAMVASRLELHDDLLRTTFRRFDVENTGFITRSSLHELLGETFEGKEVDELLNEADVDGDGKVSMSEFMDYLKRGNPSEVHVKAADRWIDFQRRRYEDCSVSDPMTPRPSPRATPRALDSSTAKERSSDTAAAKELLAAIPMEETCPLRRRHSMDLEEAPRRVRPRLSVSNMDPTKSCADAKAAVPCHVGSNV